MHNIRLSQKYMLFYVCINVNYCEMLLTSIYNHTQSKHIYSFSAAASHWPLTVQWGNC